MLRKETPEERERRILACTPGLPKQHCSHGIPLDRGCDKCEKARIHLGIPRHPITEYS